MTSRGNPSISPPAQISQQRHGNTLPSGTPPPQQFFPGQSPALPQGGFEFIAPQQQLLSYQAYGSAVNDVRTSAGGGVRGAPTQQAMHQSGAAAFYQQPGQNMRPQHPQQPGQIGQQYFISTGQNNIRPRAPHPNQQQGLVYIPQNFGNNVVIAPNMYQARPQMNTYFPVPHQNAAYMYIANGGGAPWRAPSMPQQAQPTAQPRERKLIEIKDPNTGKDLTDELINKPHVEHKPEEEPVVAVNPSGQEIGKLFTRMVAEKVNATNKESSPSPAEGQMGGLSPSPGQHGPAGVPGNQQYQQPPPQTQQPPPNMANHGMMRPGMPGMGHPRMPLPHMMPPRPGMMQQPQQQQHVQPPATPPHNAAEMAPQMLNFSRPPPHIPLRQPTPAQVYSTAQQHRVRHPQQGMPPSMRPPSIPVVMTAPGAPPPRQQHPGQPMQQQVPQPQQPAQPEPPVITKPVPEQQQPQSDSAEQSVKVETPAAPQDIPAPEEVPEKASNPNPVEKEAEPVQPAKEASPAPDATPESAAVEEAKDDGPQGASNKGAKDGRKGKKNKRDLNTKEIGGSDMDAFIDKQPAAENIGSGDSHIAEAINITNNKNLPEPQQSPIENGHKVNGHPSSDDTGLESRSDPTEEEEEGATSQPKEKEGSNMPEVTAQVESKHKLKKKKKKKGRKTPPLPKTKQGTIINGHGEEKENDSSKPPLPPTSGQERKTSVDKAPAQPESKSSTAAVEQKESPAVEVSQPKETNPVPVKEDVKEPTPEKTEPQPTPVVQEQTESVPATPPAEPVESKKTPAVVTPAVKDSNDDNSSQIENQNQPPAEDNSPPEPKTAAEPKGKSQPNGATQDVRQVTKDTFEKPSPQSPVNDENSPPKDLSFKPKTEDERPATNPLRPKAEDERPVAPPKESDASDTSAEITENAKKDGSDSRRQYDRAYLMQLRTCESSQTKPDGLPNLEIILDRPLDRIAINSAQKDFTPTFFQPTTPQRQHPQQMGKSASRGRGRPGEQMQMPRIIKSVSIQSDVKALHQSEKPWKPTPKQIASGEASGKVENLDSKCLFIMNRLTPTNFEALSKEMMALKITDFEKLQQLVKIIFDKVALETKFVEAYAQLCKKMCGLKVPPPAGMKENQATFRVLLLTKCQTEFESDKAIIFEDPEEKRKKLESEMPDAPDKKEQIDQKLYHMKLRRLKFYGNIRFIGELFKLNLLTENIMHDCIFRLLKAGDDESLLSLCQLVSTVGQILDTERAKQRMDQYYAQMKKIAEERKSRIKFTLKDAIELRMNHWVPRKETTGPKKIDEVRQDFHQEQQTKQYLQNQPPPQRQEPQPGSRRGSRQRQEEKPMPTDDGWNTVGAKSMRLDASKMKLSKTVVDENIQLGPGGGMNRFSMWSRGSGASQQSQDSPASRPSNRYSALTSNEDSRNAFSRSPSRGDSGVASRGLRQGNTAGHGRGKIIGRASMEGDRRDSLQAMRNIGGRSQNSSRDNSWNRDDRRDNSRRSMGPRGSQEGSHPMGPPRTINLRPSGERDRPPPQQAPAPTPAAAAGVKKAAPKSEEEMEQSAKTIMDEYLNIRDMKEAKLCVMELEGQKHLHLFITSSMNNVLERSDKERIMTGQFFLEIVKENMLPVDTFTKGLIEVLQFAEDMVIDIPKLWTNLAQMMTPVLTGGCMPWSQLKPLLDQHISQKNCSAKLLAEILIFAKTIVSEAEVARMWQESGLSWSQFMPADQVDDFVKDKKVEFAQGAAGASSSSSSVGFNQEKVTTDIVKIIQDGKSNEEVHAFIKDNVPQNVDPKTFVRLLITAVSKASLSAQLKPSTEVITSRVEVLTRYINSPQLELQALFAIQALMTELQHPAGAIASLFETLYNEEVINEEALKLWEVSEKEQEGKALCVLQLRQFFTWLRENDDIEAS